MFSILGNLISIKYRLQILKIKYTISLIIDDTSIAGIPVSAERSRPSKIIIQLIILSINIEN